MVRWNKTDVPHKGWKHIGIEDVYPGEEIRCEQCEMCGNEKIRYVNPREHERNYSYEVLWFVS